MIGAYKLLILTGIFIHVLGCVCFYFGFLPSNASASKTFSDRKHVHNVPAKYTHLVVMVIDALRTDFVFGEGRWSSYMAFTRKKIFHNKTYSYQARTKPPTVTMPRIKAFTSGSISGFSDIFLNIASPEFKEDNFVTQMHKAGMKMLFFGDETWLKLFPNQFERFDGTNSFFVTDYTEVDDNITRHIEKEFKQTDWNVTVMHYLGLDHIGHLAGPSSPLVGPKLIEMDRIIELIFNKLVYRDKNLGTRSLLLICGDHGMSDAGSHGGSSLQEILTPAIFIDTKAGVHFTNKTIEQVDLASNLAVLFGLQVPLSSVGRPIPLLDTLYSKKELVKINQHFACQLHSMAEDIVSETLLSQLLALCHGNTHSAEEILRLTTEHLQSLSPEYKIELMVTGICLMILGSFTLFYILLAAMPATNSSLKLIDVNKEGETASLKNKMAVQVVNIYQIVWVCLFLVSMFSSSFIEEEHYIWYYFVTSFFVLLLLLTKRSESAVLLLLLTLLRVARAWNRTGVKWIGLTDLSDWFLERNINYFVFVYMTLYVTVYGFYMYKERWSGKIALTSAFLLLTVQKLCSNDRFEALPKDSVTALYLSRLVYLNVGVMALLYQLSYVQQLKSVVVVLNMLLLRWENIPWFCTIIFIELVIIQKCLKWQTCISSEYQVFWLFHSMSKFTYFSQGNSNSLTTVDISTGIIGFDEYYPVAANLITLFATYGGEWFWFASFHDFVHSTGITSDMTTRIAVVSVLFQSIEGSIFCLLIYIERYHLFIWSVFSPRDRKSVV